MKNGILIITGIGLAFVLLQPNQRTKNINTIKKNPAGLLSTSKVGNLNNLTDEELKQMALISQKLANQGAATKEEIVYYDNLIRKYDLE
jgi:hypothetical protein